MRKIRFAIIGCGGFVQWHCERMVKDSPEFRCVALCDIVTEHAERVRDKFFAKENPPIFTDYRRMLREVKPEAVIVSTPHTLHYAHAAAALKAGAHVMVEKPMVTNATHARKLVKLAKKLKRHLQVAVQGTHTDTYAYARKLMTDGTMGKLQLVTGFLAQGWMRGTRGRWRQAPKLSGGGQLYDSCAHVIMAMVYLVNSPIKEVFCWTDNKCTPVDINAVATIKFRNGAMATLTSGGNCAAWKTHLLVQGENALMEVSAHGGNFSVVGNALKKPILAAPKGWKVKTVSPTRNFADVVLGTDTPRCPATLGIIMADLMDALYKSAATNRPVKVTKSARV